MQQHHIGVLGPYAVERRPDAGVIVAREGTTPKSLTSVSHWLSLRFGVRKTGRSSIGPRKWFGFNREWAVPLASGISICGVAARLRSAGTICARPAVPALVYSLVVVFAVVEVLILPFLAQTFLAHESLVAGGRVEHAIKTNVAAVAGGGITESLILAKNAARGRALSAGLGSLARPRP